MLVRLKELNYQGYTNLSLEKIIQKTKYLGVTLHYYASSENYQYFS